MQRNQPGTGVPFETRKAATAQHFGHVHKVCPYSKSAVLRDEIAYADLSEEVIAKPEEHGKLLEDELGKFMSDARRKMLFLLMDCDFVTHDEAHLAMKRLYVELFTAGKRIGKTRDSKAAQFSEQVRERFDLELRVPKMKISPVLSCEFDDNGKATVEGSCFTMGLNNLYHPNHPRFSPYPAFTLTRSTELEAIRQRNPLVHHDINARTAKALLSGIYPKIPYDELFTYEVVPMGGHYELAVDFHFHPDIDQSTAYRVIAEYDKSMYVYPPSLDT